MSVVRGALKANWLGELREARDEGEQKRVADLLTEIALAVPELTT